MGTGIESASHLAGMTATFVIIGGAFLLYVAGRLPVAVTSLFVLAALLLFFQISPVPDAAGANRLGAERLLAGVANPALIAIIALMVLGEGLGRTGLLAAAAGRLFRIGHGRPETVIAMTLAVALAVSAFVNNTPVVIIFIPIVQALAERIDRSPSKLLMPLSFVAILGGMPTLIGSSTNLMVSGLLVDLGEPGLGFFQFFVPAGLVALAGFAYTILVAPRLLPDRGPIAEKLAGHGHQFIAEIAVREGSRFEGMASLGGFFPDLADMTVRVVVRHGEGFFPPYDDGFRLAPGDTVVVAATRRALSEAFGNEPEHFHPAPGPDWERVEEGGHARWRVGDQMLVEAMITPTSRYVGQTISQINFRYTYHCVVIGIQRRSTMITARLTQIPLESGDVLLLQGPPEAVANLRGNRDILLMEWSREEMPAVHHARRALGIFAAVVLSAALGLVPIAVSAVAGVALMLALRVLDIGQAARAIDRDVVITIVAALALGAALDVTGGAAFLGRSLLEGLDGAGPAAVLSAFFLLVALMANLINAKTTAALFAPIAIAVSHGLALPVEPFAVAVIVAANCSFASPIGFQTNLLVLAPGNYRFTDYLRAGAPLVVVVWLAFSLVAPWYYGIP